MATIKIIQRTKPLSNGLYPIYLRITKDRKSKLISLNLSSEISQWNQSKSEFRKNYPSYKQFNSSLTAIKNRAEKIFSDSLGKGEDITLIEFEALFFDFKTSTKISVNDFWTQHIEELNASGRTGNARYFKDSKVSFFKFLNNRIIYFKDITPTLLSNYEIFLRTNGNSDSGIAIKMRAIRALYNNAIQKNCAFKDDYPFDIYKLSKLKSNPKKKALSLNHIEKIKDLDTSKHMHLIDSKNYFLFSYYVGGMNFYDMMMLTWKDINDGRITYIRRKTKGQFTIKILKPVKVILKYYYRRTHKKSKYIFPILLKENLTPIQIEYRKDKTLKKYNRDLKEIAKICGIDETITSYVARHSFATNLKQKGVSTDVISEAMGHKNLAITQAYLKDLENEVIDDAMEKLL